MNLRTIILVIIGFAFVSCSEEQSKLEEINEPIKKNIQLKSVEVNEFLGCWEENSDSSPVYWCFDTSNINKSGYVHPYSISGDSLKISEVEFSFEIADSTLRMINLLDSSNTTLKRAQLTESPDDF